MARQFKTTTKVKAPCEYFQSGISKMSSNINPDLKLERAGKEYTSSYLYNFANIIARKATEIAGNKEVLEPLDIRMAMAKFLGPDVLAYANNQGARVLTLHTSGLDVFQPRSPCFSDARGSAEKRISETTSRSIFRAVIKGLLEKKIDDLSQNVYIDRGYMPLIEDVVYHIAEYLRSDIKSSRYENISHSEISQSVAKTFPMILQEHANAHGSICVQHYLNGQLIYKRKTKRVAVPKQVKRKASTYRRTDTKIRRVEKKTTVEFSSGLPTFMSCISKRPVAINRQAASVINDHLLGICTKLLETATPKEGNLNSENIRSTVMNFFPFEMRTHAIAAANSALAAAQMVGHAETPDSCITSKPSVEKRASIRKKSIPFEPPEVQQAVTEQAAVEQTEIEQPETEQAEAEQAETQQADIQQAEIQQTMTEAVKMEADSTASETSVKEEVDDGE